MIRTAIWMAFLVAALAAGELVRADFEAGQRAWDAGDMEEALTEWRTAASAGDRRAMLALGRLHVQGLGVVQDYVQAHAWLNLAASRGEAAALGEREALAAKMTPEQIATAQERAAAWRLGASPTARAPEVDGGLGEVAPSPRAIREAQGLLVALGYRPGPADGIWGRRTGRAYQAFLRDAGLPATEALTAEVLRAMRAAANRRNVGAGPEPAVPASSRPALRPDALHRAVQAGNVDGLKAALASEVDVNARDGQGWTALMHAADKGYALMVPPLLEAGADTEIRAADGATALFMAALHGHTETIDLLMKAGAEVSVRGPKGRTAADAARVRYDDAQAAMKAGEPLSVIALLGGKTWEEVKDDEVVAFVYEAAKAGDTDTIAKALATAVYAGDAEAVKALVEAGADVNARDEYGNTPLLHTLFLLRDGAQEPDEVVVEVMTILIKGGADVNARNEYGNTPLHGFATRRLPEGVEALIEAGADVNARNKHGSTPLHASHNSYAPKRAEIIKILIKDGADVNARDESGDTPLHQFALVGPPEAVEALIEAGADLTVKDAYDSTPMHEAICCSYDEEKAAIIKILVDAGADVNATKYGMSILYLVKEGGTTFHGTKREKRAFIEFLRSLGARSFR